GFRSGAGDSRGDRRPRRPRARTLLQRPRPDGSAREGRQGGAASGGRQHGDASRRPRLLTEVRSKKLEVRSKKSNVRTEDARTVKADAGVFFAVAAIRSWITYIAVSLYVLVTGLVGMFLAVVFGWVDLLYIFGHGGVAPGLA